MGCVLVGLLAGTNAAASDPQPAPNTLWAELGFGYPYAAEMSSRRFEPGILDYTARAGVSFGRIEAGVFVEAGANDRADVDQSFPVFAYGAQSQWSFHEAPSWGGIGRLSLGWYRVDYSYGPALGVALGAYKVLSASWRVSMGVDARLLVLRGSPFLLVGPFVGIDVGGAQR